MIRMFLLGALAISPQQTDTTFAVRAGGMVEINNFAGRVHVRSWDDSRMRVRARKPAGTEVEIDIGGSNVEIDVHANRGQAGPVSLEITVPRRYDVAIDGVQMEADVADVEGDVSVTTVMGAVRISNVQGRVDAHSTQGLVTVEDSRGRLTAESVNDGVQVRNHEGDVNAEAINGPVILESIRSSNLAAVTTNGEIRFDGEMRGDGRYRLTSHNGNMIVGVPDDADATFSIDTYNGEIEADFPIQLRGTRNRRSVTFEVGSGGARVELASFGGTIHLRRR